MLIDKKIVCGVCGKGSPNHHATCPRMQPDAPSAYPSLRDGLIEVISMYQGWEESAVKIVDECILPLLQKRGYRDTSVETGMGEHYSEVAQDLATCSSGAGAVETGPLPRSDQWEIRSAMKRCGNPECPCCFMIPDRSVRDLVAAGCPLAVSADLLLYHSTKRGSSPPDDLARVRDALHCAERLADEKGSDLQYQIIAKGVLALLAVERQRERELCAHHWLGGGSDIFHCVHCTKCGAPHPDNTRKSSEDKV